DIMAPQDSAFLSELYQLMENELSNTELDVNNISRLMRMSRTKFYYKVKSLTGQTPAVFFRTYKLNRATELIATRNYTLSEIADRTGFSTLSHFSRSFKKQFGVNPSDYQQ
ncbi:MAG: AraC family transcriptional regulator, partial [Muribaculaceae bacterium]|nr:AraC family transcriptional regulator [Muribaculaceae bacterium]